VSLTEDELPSPHLQRRIREVQTFLAANLDRDVDLQAIAREAALSPYYFTRQFTAFVGVPPYRYLIGLRIERARQLLRETELTVTDVPPAHGRQPVGVPSPPRLGTGRSPLLSAHPALGAAAEQALHGLTRGPGLGPRGHRDRVPEGVQA
jgi:transcriptional regulator GlxA family with amidase domain